MLQNCCHLCLCFVNSHITNGNSAVLVVIVNSIYDIDIAVHVFIAFDCCAVSLTLLVMLFLRNYSQIFVGWLVISFGVTDGLVVKAGVSVT